MEEEYSVDSPSYYSVLGVNPDSSDEEIRRAFRKLAMQWHPDKWARRSPSLLAKAKRKFQQIQEAYSVLSDRNKRMMYDSGLYDPDEEVDEGFIDFLQEMASLMDNVKKEGKIYSMDELQGMLESMTKCFEDTTQWSRYTQESTFNSSQCYSHPFALASNSPGSMNWLKSVDSSGNSSISPYSIGQNMGFTSLSAENGLNKTFPTFWQ